MPVAPSPILSKQQSKLPTSMRYERVQEILENEPAFRNRLSPKNHPVQTRFGEKVMFSKETVDITEALHSEGKDAHKVPKNDVLKAAARILRVIAGNGETTPVMPVTVPRPVEPTPPIRKPRARPVATAAPEAETPEPVAVKAKKVKKKPEPVAVKPPAPQPESKPVRVNKPEPIKPASQAVTSVEEEQVPESELPPEKQPLRLPPDFDPSQFPHYSVQTSIYALLLSALNLGEHYEKFPGAENRHKKLEDVMKDYLSTCDALKLKTT